jgi:nitric oxide reductase NorD protein
VSSLWQRITAAVRGVMGAPERGRERTMHLDDVRGRLELLLTALYDRSIQIAAAKPEPRQHWIRRRLDGRPKHLVADAVLGTTDGVGIELPASIDAAPNESKVAEFQLLAVEQAERLTRGTPAMTPGSDSLLVRDLFLIREGMVVDAAIARNVPGLRGVLQRARAAALEARPDLSKLTPLEREVEGLLRDSLAALSPSATRDETPQGSHAWARTTAERIRASNGASAYRGIAPVPAWGAASDPALGSKPSGLQSPSLGVTKLSAGVTSFSSDDGGEGKRQGNEFGRSKGGGQEDDQPGDATASANGNADLVASRQQQEGSAAGTAKAAANEVKVDTDALLRAAAEQSSRRISRLNQLLLGKVVDGGIAYPEWDCVRGTYRLSGSIVREQAKDAPGGALYHDTVRAHAPIVRRLRKEFEILRARRLRLGRQRDGDEIDLDACVRALVDRRAGRTIDDELYMDIRPSRRGLGITLLVDVSDSTDDWIATRDRIIDVERVALILANEALDALGDLYSILTFSGVGRDNVRVQRIKDFTEKSSAPVHARIAALEPDGYTRAGAAIRHATAQSLRQPVKHRLLLLLSDGRPNDRDEYDGLMAIEDTRAAVLEARQRGVHPFCLTIDRQEQNYVRRIFGSMGYTVLQRPEQLPSALVKAVRLLLSH